MLRILYLLVALVVTQNITVELQRECDIARQAFIKVRPSWSNWEFPSDCRRSNYVQVDGDSITAIKFPFFSGTEFPVELMELKNVTQVLLGSVSFSGPYPSNLTWPKLEVLYFPLT
jgi:hypothetical protein